MSAMLQRPVNRQSTLSAHNERSVQLLLAFFRFFTENTAKPPLKGNIFAFFQKKNRKFLQGFRNMSIFAPNLWTREGDSAFGHGFNQPFSA